MENVKGGQSVLDVRKVRVLYNSVMYSEALVMKRKVWLSSEMLKAKGLVADLSLRK